MYDSLLNVFLETKYDYQLLGLATYLTTDNPYSNLRGNILLTNKPSNQSEKLVGEGFQKAGVKVEYQYHIPNYNYYLDIFLPQFKVNIEVDGPYHIINTRAENDMIRRIHLRFLGIKQYIITSTEAHDPSILRELIKVITNHIDPNERHIPAPWNRVLVNELIKWIKLNPLPPTIKI